jgi:DNA-directed RNA polymerase subunit RPC12/RpoP
MGQRWIYMYVKYEWDRDESTCTWNTNGTEMNLHVREIRMGQRWIYMYVKYEWDRDESTWYICPHCGKQFRSKFGLTLHEKNKHDKSFKHICNMCQKGFNQSVQYRFHLSSHMKVLLEKCMFCKEEFMSHGSLKRHLTTCQIIDKDKFVCDICQSFFIRKDRLQEPIQGKHNEPKYLCINAGNGTHGDPA